MPTIFPISDIHLEFHKDGGKTLLKELPVDGIDILVIAGDLGRLDGVNAEEHLSFLLSVCMKGYKDVILVPGNHEYWGVSPIQANAYFNKYNLMEHRGCSLHVFSNPAAVEIQGVKIVGGTMWFPEPSPLDWHWAQRWTDFKQIKYNRNQASNCWIYEQHDLFQNVLWGEEDIDVVITHHAPSYQSVHDRFRGSPDNIFFISKQEEAILEKKPRAWIHGHMHNSFDYTIGDTRVVCNPFGYVGYDLHEPYSPNVRVII